MTASQAHTKIHFQIIEHRQMNMLTVSQANADYYHLLLITKIADRK